jgi:enamine deaminase RidA (YjgF/YER057c/UK114 family)
MSKISINPSQLFDSQRSGFAQVVVAEGKRTVYLSGQVAWGPERNIVGVGNFSVQVDEAFKNVQVAMQAAGGTMADVVSLRIYIVQAHMSENQAVRDALLRYFPGDSPPASTWIGVAGLAHQDFLVEIEAIAVLD